jgi:AcrR family transcriptional regulator
VTSTAPPLETTKSATASRSRRPATKRAERRAFRRDEIMKTAFALVEEGGLDAVTTTELAKRTGAALGALYRFFPSKAAVIAALQKEALDELHADLTAAMKTATTSATSARAGALAALVAIADVVFGEPRTHAARFRLIDEALSRLAPIHSDADAAALERSLEPLLQLAQEQVVAFVGAKTASAEHQRFAFALWAALHGVTHFIKRDRLVPAPVQSARVAATTVRLLCKGLGATDAELAAAWTAAAPTSLVVDHA